MAIYRCSGCGAVNRTHAEAYAIQVPPTLVLFQDGSEVARRCDAPGPSDMGAWLEQASAPR
jgi:hypothetical protein